jgi:hypothetical protein
LVREEPTGDVTASQEQLEAFERDFAQLAAAYERFLDSNPGEWIACSDGRFYTAARLSDLDETLRVAGIDPSSTPREFMQTRKLAL